MTYPVVKNTNTEKAQTHGIITSRRGAERGGDGERDEEEIGLLAWWQKSRKIERETKENEGGEGRERKESNGYQRGRRWASSSSSHFKQEDIDQTQQNRCLGWASQFSGGVNSLLRKKESRG